MVASQRGAHHSEDLRLGAVRFRLSSQGRYFPTTTADVVLAKAFVPIGNRIQRATLHGRSGPKPANEIRRDVPEAAEAVATADVRAFLADELSEATPDQHLALRPGGRRRTCSPLGLRANRPRLSSERYGEGWQSRIGGIGGVVMVAALAGPLLRRCPLHRPCSLGRALVFVKSRGQRARVSECTAAALSTHVGGAYLAAVFGISTSLVQASASAALTLVSPGSVISP